MNAKTLLTTLVLGTVLTVSGVAGAGLPVTKNGVTTIHLDEYNGYFAARDTLVELKPGKYKFVVMNKTDKLVGFWLQDGKTHKQLDKFPIDPGQTASTTVQITGNGFRYRCPINPTPWYDVAVN